MSKSAQYNLFKPAESKDAEGKSRGVGTAGCPLDDELVSWPISHFARYEAHIVNCPACKGIGSPTGWGFGPGTFATQVSGYPRHTGKGWEGAGTIAYYGKKRPCGGGRVEWVSVGSVL